MTILYIVISAFLLLPLVLVQSGNGSSPLTVPSKEKGNCARHSDEDAEF